MARSLFSPPLPSPPPFAAPTVDVGARDQRVRGPRRTPHPEDPRPGIGRARWRSFNLPPFNKHREGCMSEFAWFPPFSLVVRVSRKVLRAVASHKRAQGEGGTMPVSNLLSADTGYSAGENPGHTRPKSNQTPHGNYSAGGFIFGGVLETNQGRLLTGTLHSNDRTLPLHRPLGDWVLLFPATCLSTPGKAFDFKPSQIQEKRLILSPIRPFPGAWSRHQAASSVSVPFNPVATVPLDNDHPPHPLETFIGV